MPQPTNHSAVLLSHGVPKAGDVCPNTALGLPVCANGRPQRDCNIDCHYDAADIQCCVEEALNQ